MLYRLSVRPASRLVGLIAQWIISSGELEVECATGIYFIEFPCVLARTGECQPAEQDHLPALAVENKLVVSASWWNRRRMSLSPRQCCPLCKCLPGIAGLSRSGLAELRVDTVFVAVP